MTVKSGRPEPIVTQEHENKQENWMSAPVLLFIFTFLSYISIVCLLTSPTARENGYYSLYCYHVFSLNSCIRERVKAAPASTCHEAKNAIYCQGKLVLWWRERISRVAVAQIGPRTCIVEQAGKKCFVQSLAGFLWANFAPFFSFMHHNLSLCPVSRVEYKRLHSLGILSLLVRLKGTKASGVV